MAEEEFLGTIEEEESRPSEEEVVYVCAGCGEVYTLSKLMQESEGALRCRKCTGRIFYKPRGISRERPRKIYAI